MSSDGERQLVASLLGALDEHERLARQPAERLALEVDGKRVEELELADGPVLFRLPERARSVCLKDERGTIRAYLGLDELDADERSCDEGRILLSLERHSGSVALRVEANDPASGLRRTSLVDLDSAGARASAEPLPGGAPKVGEWGADDGVAVSRIRPRPVSGRRRPSWLGALAFAAATLGCVAGALYWHEQTRENEARLMADKAERRRLQEERAKLEQERAKLEQERRATEERIARLVDELAKAKDDSERAKIQAELETERAAAAAAKGSGVGGGAVPSRTPRHACKPGDPLCSDL
jgi:cell division protein FtsB